MITSSRTTSAADRGWRERTIRELCHILSGGTPRKTEASFWQGTIPWVSGKDLKSPILDDSIDHISEQGLQAGSRLAPSGAVLLLVRGMGLAKDLPVAAISRPMAFNQDIKALVPRTALPATFLRAAIYHARGRLLSRIVPSAHGTMTLNLHDVENLSVSVPDDINEAKAIASVLHFAQGAISVEGRHLAALRDFKRAILGELFSRGLQRETSKDSDIGKIPQSWTVTTLGALISEGAGRIQTGPFGSQLHAHEYQSSGIPIVNPTHLAGNKINHEEVPRISEERAKSLSRHFLREGDLLFARRGEIGRLGLVNQGEVGWLCGTGCFLVRVRHDHICNSFLARFFSTDGVIAWLKANAAGAIMPNLNNVVLAKVPVAYPTVDEQRRITSILSTLDRKIDVQERKGEALAMLSRALTHKLMTGTISVDQLDYSALRKEGASP